MQNSLEQIEDGLITLNVNSCVLTIEGQHEIQLTFSQMMLFRALMQGMTQKKDIIAFIWGTTSEKEYENNYHQLIFQTRKLLRVNELPVKLLTTIPRHGLRLNESVLKAIRITHKNKLRRLLNRIIDLS